MGPAGDATVDDLERAILGLLDARVQAASICPSDAARAAHAADDDGWRDLMDPARAAVQRLAGAGRVEITRRGQPLDLARVRGPVRIRLRS